MASFLSATDPNWWVGASFSWGQGEWTGIRVYGSKPDGSLVEWQWDAGNGWAGPSDLPGKATAHTPLAVTHREIGGKISIRLYYHADGRIKELCYDDGWTQGSTLP